MDTGNVQITGPNRVGPYGLFQPIIDAVKLIFKEDIVPADAHRVLFVLAPALELITVSLALAVIPFGDTLRIPFTDHEVTLIAADIVTRQDPFILHHRPIASSVSVAKDDVPLARSRAAGFDYRGDNNSLVFVAQDFDPDHSSEVVVGYRRWVHSTVQPQ